MARYLIHCFYLFILTFMSVGSVGAAVVPGSSCDPDFLEVMKARSWMQGKREMEVAQSLILKSGSVLQYSCFKQRASEGNAESGLVQSTASRYLNKNFSYFNAGAGDPCEMMEKIWSTAKCTDIAENPFSSFEELIGNDPRTFPESCALIEKKRKTNWNNAVSASDLPNEDIMEIVAPYMSSTMAIFDPANCTNSMPLKTGLIIFENVYTTNNNTTTKYKKPRLDRICIAPGCYYSYDPENLNGAGECVSEPPQPPASPESSDPP